MTGTLTRRGLLQRGSAASAAIGAVTSGGSLAVAAVTNAGLEQRAARFRELILQVATGPGGMIIAFPRFHDRRPPQEGEPQNWYFNRVLEDAWGGVSPRPTVAEWLYGENTLWATGWFLWSQILRYRATKQPEALETARKCFRDLNNIFRHCRSIEPGLLGKPHGGRGGPTTSFDQAASPVLFYTMFAKELATPEEKAEAVSNMAAHGEYYLRRNWVMNHHGNFQRIVDPAITSTMKYLACVHAAYDLTGEKRYRDAAFKYVRQILQVGKLPWPSDPTETNHNFFYWAMLCDYWSKTEMAADADWNSFIRAYWSAAQMAIDKEGLHRFGHYSGSKHTFTPYPDRWLTKQDAAEWPAQAPRNTDKRWVSSTCLGNRALNSACNAALALLARSRGLDDQAHHSARRTLERMDENALRWFWDDGKLPADMKPLLNLFAPEVAGMWLSAYWMGRVEKAW